MKINFECKDEYVMEEEMLAFLICEGDVFLNNGWYKPDHPKDMTTLHVNCGDTFGYACADAEDLLYGEIPDLYKHVKRDPILGSMVWCIKKRKCKPIKERIQQIQNSGLYISDMVLQDVLK